MRMDIIRIDKGSVRCEDFALEERCGFSREYPPAAAG